METTNLKTPDGMTLSAVSQVPVDGDLGSVLLAHGITADKDEEGFFTALADTLEESRIASLRFDFRGHGASAGKPEEMTVAGESVDLATAFAELARRFPDVPHGIIAASFGAAATSRAIAERTVDPGFLVLINPVLDMRRTFTQPELPWGKESFTPAALAALPNRGVVMIDGEFPAGKKLVDEMESGPQPAELLAEVNIPMLVIHGTEDTYVSYDISREFAEGHISAEFVAVDGAEHGFGREHETKFVVDAVANWVSNSLSVTR